MPDSMLPSLATSQPPKADVLVIGLGPAGISAARVLARGGARVLAVDRRELPLDKACAGGLTNRCCQILGYSSAEPWSFSRRCVELEVRAGAKTKVLRSTEAAVVTVDRPQLTRLLLEELRDLGVIVRLGDMALPGDFGAIAACDGATSRTRRALKLPTAAGSAALQLRLADSTAQKAGLKGTRCVVWFDPDLWGSGYAWSFPAPGEVRLGCGVPLSAKGGLRRRFEKFLASLGLSIDSGRLEAGLVGTRYCGHRFGKFHLAGDAAGLASPLTGEGIYQALVSGAEVAREILEPGYFSPIIADLATRHRRTLGVLEHSGAAALLYPWAPFLLRLGPIARLTEQKYLN
jgi:geranylgeranyl reductase